MGNINEAHVIIDTFECIAKLIDDYTMVDTGSIDNTNELIKEFFEKHNISNKIA